MVARIYHISNRAGDTMNLIDYIVFVGLAVAVICVVVWIIRRKKRCGSGCGCCSYKDNCLYKNV